MAFDTTIPSAPFTDFAEFQKWYFEELERNMPVPMEKVINSSNPSFYTRMLPHWSEEQIDMVFEYVENLVSFPEGVFLQYDPDMYTIYSKWDDEDGVFRISLTTNFILFLAYPPIVEIGIAHEFGHIFNGDCLNSHECHNDCANTCQDVRINAGLDRKLMDEFYASIFYQPDGECPFVPERFYPTVGLEVNEAGWSYQITHNAYHASGMLNDCERAERQRKEEEKKKENEKPTEKIPNEMPRRGEVVMSGDVYGLVTDVDDKTRDITVQVLTREDALKILMGDKANEVEVIGGGGYRSLGGDVGAIESLIRNSPATQGMSEEDIQKVAQSISDATIQEQEFSDDE